MKPKFILMLASFFLLLTAQAQDAQKRKTRFPAGLYTTGNSDIYGISVGIGSDTYDGSETVSVRSNGLRIEPISQSLLFFTLIFPVDMVKYPSSELEYSDFDNKIPNEIINGINLSCGTNAFANVNGITVSAITQSLKNTNGISIAGLSSYANRSNGVQLSLFNTSALYSNGLMAGGFQTEVYTGRGVNIAVWYNEYKYFDGLMISACNGMVTEPEEFRGLQIGIVNRTKKLRGIQIGLWNINGRRSLPLVNWDFSNKPPKPPKPENERTKWINQSNINKPSRNK